MRLWVTWGTRTTARNKKNTTVRTKANHAPGLCVCLSEIAAFISANGLGIAKEFLIKINGTSIRKAAYNAQRLASSDVLNFTFEFGKSDMQGLLFT